MSMVNDQSTTQNKRQEGRYRKLAHDVLMRTEFSDCEITFGFHWELTLLERIGRDRLKAVEKSGDREARLQTDNFPSSS